jgi:hypothetical protein
METSGRLAIQLREAQIQAVAVVDRVKLASRGQQVVLEL